MKKVILAISLSLVSNFAMANTNCAQGIFELVSFKIESDLSMRAIGTNMRAGGSPKEILETTKLEHNEMIKLAILNPIWRVCVDSGKVKTNENGLKEILLEEIRLVRQ